MTTKKIEKYLLRSPAGRHWKKIGVRRRAGILFPLFSLRTKKNMGIGEFSDLKLLVEWCMLTGMSVIQLLPVNDTGSRNHPYSALSAFALNPVYLSPLEMDGCGNNQTLIKKISTLVAGQSRKNDRIDYASVHAIKSELFEALFTEFEKENSSRKIEKFKQYRKRNKAWLHDYSLYMALKEKYGNTWEEWPEKYRERKSGAMSVFRKKWHRRIRFYAYLQWQAEKQFVSVHHFAANRGILIKGDIPFLVGRDSADVWANRGFFNMETSAGAPPDFFSKTGQKWGFPTFNWEAMKREGYRWYRRRLRHAQKFYDLYRLDHALGLYRIYTIDSKLPDGSKGFFDPPDESEWEKHGEELITMMLKSTRMLPIAEDLGVVPDCTRPNLKKLGVPRTIVDRWERSDNGDSPYPDLEKAEPVAMNTLSTHDTETVRQWWNNYPEERTIFYHTLGFEGDPPEKLTADLHQRVLERSFSSGCLFTIHLPQDIFRWGPFACKPEQHRINIPTTVSDENWAYIFPVMLEELIHPTAPALEEENRRIRELVENSGRA